VEAGGLAREFQQRAKDIGAAVPESQSLSYELDSEGLKIVADMLVAYGVLILPTTGRYLQIPYRSLLPKAVRNLLVAGRATGGDRIAHAATRNMSCCIVTGQGAGVAAALSIRTNCDLTEVDITATQIELERQNVRID
jgi:hypothetical protein